MIINLSLLTASQNGIQTDIVIYLQNLQSGFYYLIPDCSKSRGYYDCESSRHRFVAATTALIKLLRNAPFSNSWIPAMVVPAGDATASLSCPGCFPVWFTIAAAPSTCIQQTHLYPWILQNNFEITHYLMERRWIRNPHNCMWLIFPWTRWFLTVKYWENKIQSKKAK